MPVIKTIQVNKERQVAIWHITESTEDLIAALDPKPEDLDFLLSFKSEKKQQEWLAGRLTLNYLCAQYNLSYRGVSKDQYGKPSLKGSPHEISITHSHPYVAAIIDPEKAVGIDLEQPREKVIRISGKFCHEKELKFAENDMLKLNFIWCAKETLYKIHSRKRLIFKEDLLIEPFETDPLESAFGSIIVNDTKERHKLVLKDFKDYILCYNN